MNPVPLNPLVTTLLASVRNAATSFKQNKNTDINPVLQIVEEIVLVEQLGFCECPSTLVEYFNETHGVIYLPVGVESGLWTCGCFVIPPNASIPLHDHPEMTGIIRVLEGTIEIESYDVCSTNLARPCGSTVFEAPSTACLGPTQANIHQVTAGPEGATFLDILMPDYDDDSGRSCNFYKLGDLVVLSSDETNRQNSVEVRAEEQRCISCQYRELIVNSDISNEVNIYTGNWPQDSFGKSISSSLCADESVPSSRTIEPPPIPDDGAESILLSQIRIASQSPSKPPPSPFEEPI